MVTAAARVRGFTFCSHHDGNGIIFFMGLKDQKWTNPVSTRVCGSAGNGGAGFLSLANAGDHDGF